MIDSADLVGIEIGQKSVRAIVLSSDASSIVRFADTAIPATPGLPDISESIQALWRELGLDLSTHVRAAVAVSHIHAGIGSGPSIESWIDSLGGDLEISLIRVGERFEGVSYFPKEFLDAIGSGFEPLGVEPDRIELAPIAAARCFAPKSTCSFTVESGVSWQARVHSGLILEAMVAETPSAHSGVAIAKGPDTGHISSIHGLELTDELLASLRITVSDIAVAAGAARGLVERPAGNLLEGTVGQPSERKQTPAPSNTPPQPVTPIKPASSITQLPHQAAQTPRPASPTPAADSEQFKPLPPQHITTIGGSTIPIPEGTNPAAQATPSPLEPGKQRAGFEPTEEETANSTTESPAVTPAFLPPSGTITNKTPDIEPSAEPRAAATISPAGRKRGRRSKERPSTIEAQRPRIDRHEDEFPSEPFAGKTQAASTYNLKLLAGALTVLIIIGLIIFFVGPS